MIKLIIKESKELKTANEILLDQINNFVARNKLSNSENAKYFNINIQDLLYLDNKKTLGLPYFYYYHILNKTSNLKLKNYWNEKDFIFDEKFISNIKNKSLPINVSCKIDSSQTAIAKAGAATKNNKSLFLIMVYLNNVNIDTFKNKIAHEFRHFTQRINDICIYYGEQLQKLKDPNKVRMEEIQNIPSKFGLGRDVTKTSKINDKDKFAASSKDVEYETYLADLVQSYYSRLMKDPQKIKNDINSLGVNAAAVKYIKLLFNVYRFKNSYQNINGVIEKILEKRPKELPKDMLGLLSNKFSAL